MAIKTLDDIEREKHNQNRERIKSEITEDVNDVIGNIFGKKPPKRRKNIIDWFWTIIKLLGIIIILLIIINLFLGNIWLLRFFIKSLFGL